MTVGEMIAAHHTCQASWHWRATELAWGMTDLGRAFSRYEVLRDLAWIADGNPSTNDKSLKLAWERADKARDEFLALVRR